MHSKGAEKGSFPQAKMTILKVRLLQLTKVKENKAIFCFYFYPNVDQKPHLCVAYCKKTQTPHNTLNSGISSLD